MLNPETFLSTKISFLSLRTLSSGIHAFLFTHLSPDVHACYFHHSRHFRLPITLHLARRLGAFEFTQPNIQRLGSLYPTLLDLILALYFTQTSRKEKLPYQVPMPPGSFYLFIFCIFPATPQQPPMRRSQRHTSFTRTTGCPAAGRELYLLKISQFCVSFQDTLTRAFLVNFSGEGW